MWLADQLCSVTTSCPVPDCDRSKTDVLREEVARCSLGRTAGLIWLQIGFSLFLALPLESTMMLVSSNG